MQASFLVATTFAALAFAFPLQPVYDLILCDNNVHRALPPVYDDIDTLHFALYLENFANAFYREGFANWTQADFADYGFDADFYSNLTDIASHERTHVRSLNTTLEYLNAPLVSECIWAFNVTTPLQFVITASLVESVSASAYVGIIANLTDTDLRTVEASVLAVEARHSSFIRASLGQQPFATPFEVPLTLSEAYDLAELFKVSCPASNPPLHLKTFGHLSSSFSNHGVVGGEVTFLTFGEDHQPPAGSDELYLAFLTITGPIFAPAIPVPGLGFNVTVPASPAGFAPINGFILVVLTASNTSLTDDDIIAGPATIEIYLK